MNTMTYDPAMALREPPGALVGWVRWVVAIACVLTIATPAIGGSLIARELAWFVRGSESLFWLKEGIAYLAAAGIAASIFATARVSRFLRAGVLLPVVHAGLVGVAWYIWRSLLPHLSEASDGRVFAAGFPLVHVAAIATVTLAGVAAVIARPKRHEWAHGFAMLALAELLLVGLWMPILCAIVGRHDFAWWYETNPLLQHPLATAAWIAIPPTLVSIAFTALSLRRPGLVARHRKLIVAALGVFAMAALLSRMTAGARAMVIYSNYVPLLLAGVIVAVVALVALAIATLVRGYVVRRMFASRERLVGVIEAVGTEPVIGFEIDSWLRGPRVVQRPFTIATSSGLVPVTGAELVAPLPETSTRLARGETLGVLHPRDTVIVAGHADGEGGPFRASAAPLAGELFIAPADADRAGFASMALAMWRPCVAYLLIVTTIAVPALAALLV